jgi:hypothetical protein
MNIDRRLMIFVACLAVLAVTAAAAVALSDNPLRDKRDGQILPKVVPQAVTGTAEVLPNVSPGHPGAQEPRSQRDVAGSLKTLAREFAIVRRAPDRSGAWSAQASNGDRLSVYVDKRGLCLDSLGGTACGDPNRAATSGTVAHAISSKGEQVAGIVPDKVETVRVEISSGNSRSVNVQNNVFAIRLKGSERTTDVRWLSATGSVLRRVP